MNSNYLQAVHSGHTCGNWSLRAEALVYDLCMSTNPLKRVILARLVSSIALPILHTVDVIQHLALAARAKKHLQPTGNDLLLAKEHSKQIFTSFFWGVIAPKKTLSLPSKMQEVRSLTKAITYKMGPASRLGDNISCYLSAKWVAHKLGLPLVVQPFAHVDEIKLLSNAKHVAPSSFLSCKKISSGVFSDTVETQLKNSAQGLYQIPFIFNAKIDWTDKAFRLSVLDDLTPTTNLDAPKLKEDALNVAIHYRDGGAFDPLFVQFAFPIKFPPIEYYQKQMEYLMQKHPDQNIHFQIFTDALDIPALKKKFEDFLATLPKTDKQKVSIDAKITSGKELETQVIQDMCAMSKYDCLVRADSGLSKLSGLIGATPIEISPTGFTGDISNGHIKATINGIEIRSRNRETGEPSFERRSCSYTKTTPTHPVHMNSIIIRRLWG